MHKKQITYSANKTSNDLSHAPVIKNIFRKYAVQGFIEGKYNM